MNKELQLLDLELTESARHIDHVTKHLVAAHKIIHSLTEPQYRPMKIETDSVELLDLRRQIYNLLGMLKGVV